MLLFALQTILLSGEKGETGEQGEQGLQGEKGDKGDKGDPGIDGKDIEFRTTDTHIQWRYVTSDNSDTWKNLVALNDIKANNIPEYIITYDYNCEADISGLFTNYISSQTVKSGEWVVNMPFLNINNASEYFDGWYIKDTNK